VGDLYLFNNLALLHRRDDIGIEIGSGQCRHLVRLCVRSGDMGWRIPVALSEGAVGWREAFANDDDDEGKGRERIWHVEPVPEEFFPLIRKTN